MIEIANLGGFQLINYLIHQRCGEQVEKHISLLTERINYLNPDKIDFLDYKKTTFFNPVKRYFKRIKSQEPIISTLIDSLTKEQEILKRDNITLKIEIDKLNKVIEDLNNEFKNGNTYLEKLNKNISKEEISHLNISLFEKRLFDFKQMIIVKEQSVLGLKIILNNNNEIIRNIDKIRNVTVEALKTSVMVANSIFNQKIILKKINSLDKGAQNLLKDTNSLIQFSDFNDELSRRKIFDILKNNFEKMINTLNTAKNDSEKYFPENNIKILEIKKGK